MPLKNIPNEKSIDRFYFNIDFCYILIAMGMGLCVAFIAFVRLPSLKVSTLLLTGLLIYDVFWVFFSSYLFNANVMVKVSKVPSVPSPLKQP